jgi:hypothetical protein
MRHTTTIIGRGAALFAALGLAGCLGGGGGGGGGGPIQLGGDAGADGLGGGGGAPPAVGADAGEDRDPSLPDAGGVEPDAGGAALDAGPPPAPTCRIVETVAEDLATGAIIRRTTFTWNAGRTGYVSDWDEGDDGTVDRRLTWERDDAARRAVSTFDSDLDGVPESRTETTLNATGQSIETLSRTMAGDQVVITRCTATYAGTDPATPEGALAERTVCDEGDDGAPDRVEAYVFEGGRPVRLERDVGPPRWPIDAEPTPDGQPDGVTTYTYAGQTVTARADGGGYGCSGGDGVCTPNLPDGTADRVDELTVADGDDPGRLYGARVTRQRSDHDGDGTWDQVTETTFDEDRWQTHRLDLGADGTWDQQTVATYACD